MPGLVQEFDFFFFFEKGRNFNREKDFKREHWFVKNLNMGDSEGPKKRYVFDIWAYFKNALESFLSFVLL